MLALEQFKMSLLRSLVRGGLFFLQRCRSYGAKKMAGRIFIYGVGFLCVICVGCIKMPPARGPVIWLRTRRTAMTRFLIYLFPALADVIIAAAMFVCSNRLADAGRSGTEVAAVFIAWAVMYVVTNQILAKLVTSHNAAALLIVANLLFSATAGAFVLFDGIWEIYAIMGVLSVASALFFLPFQVFMKAVEPDQHQGVVRSAAIYIFAWSMGYAAGPFVAGFIYQWLGWQWCFALTGTLGLLTAGGVQLLKHHAKHHHAEAIAPSQARSGRGGREVEAVNYHAMDDLAWLGWVIGGAGVLGLYLFLVLLPSVGVTFAMPKSQVGSIVALLYFVQASVGLGLLRSRTWMFRLGPRTAFAAFGILGLAGFGVSLLPALDGIEIFAMPLRTLGLYASVVCYGVFSGSFFFGLVFHALVHPRRSARYVAINETVVGLGGVAGPVLVGTLADRFNSAVPAATLIAIVACAAILQIVMLRKRSQDSGVRIQ